MAPKARILYLYASSAENGFGHIRCRKLIEVLRREYDVVLQYRIVPDDEHARATNPSYLQQTISEANFRQGDFEIVFLEEKLGITDSKMQVKVRSSVLKSFMDEGGMVVFLCHDSELTHYLTAYNAYLREVGLPTIRQPRSIQEFPSCYESDGDFDRYAIQGVDEKHALRGYERYFWIQPTAQYLNYIDSQLRDAYSDVTRLVVRAPSQVATSKPVLAGNPGTTRMLCSNDHWWDGDLFFVFGGYADFTNGCGVTITGQFCNDFVIDEEPSDNLQFMNNLVRLLLLRQRERRPLLALPLPKLVRQAQESVLLESSDSIEVEDEALLNRVIEQIHQATQSHPSARQHEMEAREFLQVALKDCWQHLELQSREFLVTGESVFRAFRSSQNFDFAPVAVEFAKAVELELKVKLVDLFADRLQSRGILQQVVQETRQRKGAKPMLLDAVDPENTNPKSLTPSQLARELEDAPSSQHRIHAELVLFIKSSKQPDNWLDPHQLPATLRTIGTRYRNGSAHIHSMTLQLCEEWRDLLLGLGQQPSILCQLISTRPV